MLDHALSIDFSAPRTSRRKSRHRFALSSASMAVLFCVSGALADSATVPGPAPAAQSGEFVEQPVGDYAMPAAAPAASGTQGAATAQPVGAAPSAPAAASSGAGGGPFGFVNGIGHSASLFGDMWGLRPVLASAGMTLTIQEQSETSAM